MQENSRFGAGWDDLDHWSNCPNKLFSFWVEANILTAQAAILKAADRRRDGPWILAVNILAFFKSPGRGIEIWHPW